MGCFFCAMFFLELLLENYFSSHGKNDMQNHLFWLVVLLIKVITERLYEAKAVFDVIYYRQLGFYEAKAGTLDRL